MTQKLYYSSAYIREWSTEITNTVEREDGIYIALEESAFYPEGGGQPSDYGWIGNAKVLGVQSEKGQLLHQVDQLPAGGDVNCRLDWHRRFDHMQHHSAQHLLSAVCLQELSASTLSFHLGQDYCTIDIERSQLSQQELRDLELAVQQEIYENHSIKSYWVSLEQAEALPVVKPPAVTGDIRIVEIEGIEYNPCGGTHVSATGEIGMIKLLKCEKQKGHTRIYFKSGYRALQEFNQSADILAKLSVRFHAPKEEMMNRVAKWEQEQRQLLVQVQALKAENDAYLGERLLAQRDGGVVHSSFADRSLKDLQSLALRMIQQEDVVIVLKSDPDLKVLIAHRGDQHPGCGAYVKQQLHSGAKGGGSDSMAQASFTTAEDANVFYKAAVKAFASLTRQDAAEQA
ncbi:Threonyl/alanyl tRNA synthetase SAD [Paenibacillus algicola]|uniref:Threonyl/alanyl tRNA synthetase SAD n=1 Tax=Paenibacillus algicola TaxID=2565926 RepID=A0A4P8XLM0_9BACL|nr:alanyl-tRNA editing protein [Paenibacillus algicola]QCT03388.1 Threonyl/alanyl tRNA synthetase SAD [Paenibacillus algicola]